MGNGNGERSPPAKQLFGINMAGMMESNPHLLYFHLLEYLNDGEYSPFIMIPSLPNICNDGEYSLSKNPPFPSTTNLRIAIPWFGTNWRFHF
jgi:hypothetical protein